MFLQAAFYIQNNLQKNTAKNPSPVTKSGPEESEISTWLSILLQILAAACRMGEGEDLLYVLSRMAGKVTFDCLPDCTIRKSLKGMYH